MAQREDVEFRSGDDRISAWLYRPAGGDAPPILVMAHGLGAVRAWLDDMWGNALERLS